MSGISPRGNLDFFLISSTVMEGENLLVCQIPKIINDERELTVFLSQAEYCIGLMARLTILAIKMMMMSPGEI